MQRVDQFEKVIVAKLPRTVDQLGLCLFQQTGRYPQILAEGVDRLPPSRLTKRPHRAGQILDRREINIGYTRNSLAHALCSFPRDGRSPAVGKTHRVARAVLYPFGLDMR